jgi:adenosylmethionine-8-amino-7-oxononanoate aminotransferase
VEFVADKKTKEPFPADMAFSGKVAAAAAKRGLLVYPMQGTVDGVSGDHILLAPPAVINTGEISWSLEQLSASIGEAARKL